MRSAAWGARTIFEGLEQGPEALNALFTGANIGKTMIRP